MAIFQLLAQADNVIQLVPLVKATDSQMDLFKVQNQYNKELWCIKTTVFAFLVWVRGHFSFF